MTLEGPSDRVGMGSGYTEKRVQVEENWPKQADRALSTELKGLAFPKVLSDDDKGKVKAWTPSQENSAYLEFTIDEVLA